MSYMSTSEQHEDDDELPSYESCLSEFTTEAASANPGEYEYRIAVSESSTQPPASFAPEIPFPHPPIIPTGTKPTNNAGTDADDLVNHSRAVPNPGSPVYNHGPPPIRRETRPDTFADTSPPATSASAYHHYDKYYLLVDGLYPSDTLCRLADALFTQLTLSEFLDPLALARASDPSIRSVVFTPRMLFRLTRFLTIAGIPFTRTASDIPVLTRSSFIQWLVFEMRANPDYSYTTWKTRLENYSLYDPHTNTTFIGPIPRTAFPAQPVDAVLTNVHDVWRAIVHVLGKRQGKPNGAPAPVAGGTHSRPHNAAATPGRGRGGGGGKWAFRGSDGREDTRIASERKLIRGFERGTVRGVARGIFRGLF